VDHQVVDLALHYGPLQQAAVYASGAAASQGDAYSLLSRESDSRYFSFIGAFLAC
jgi:hypothetical protein